MSRRRSPDNTKRIVRRRHLNRDWFTKHKSQLRAPKKPKWIFRNFVRFARCLCHHYRRHHHHRICLDLIYLLFSSSRPTAIHMADQTSLSMRFILILMPFGQQRLILRILLLLFSVEKRSFKQETFNFGGYLCRASHALWLIGRHSPRTQNSDWMNVPKWQTSRWMHPARVSLLALMAILSKK